MFDSDMTTFGNRVTELFKWAEQNLGIFRSIIQDYTINKDRLLEHDLTKEDIPTDFRAFRLMIPILVRIFGTVFGFAACFVMPESYILGHFLGVGSTVIFSFLINFNAFKHMLGDRQENFSDFGAYREQTHFNMLSEEE